VYLLDERMGIMKVIEKNMFFGAKAELFSLALQMRKNPTEAERVMWKILRKFRQSGFPFRRQHPIEFYIADFYCHNLRLVIEVDGEIQSHDEGRTGELERFGIKVLRFTNNQILHDSDLVVEKINATIKELTTTSRMIFPRSHRERGNEGERPVNQIKYNS
jgi:very-short-patch-repair endonuclease